MELIFRKITNVKAITEKVEGGIVLKGHEITFECGHITRTVPHNVPIVGDIKKCYECGKERDVRN